MGSCVAVGAWGSLLILRARKMVQGVKAPAVELTDLSSIPGTHMVDNKNSFMLSSDCFVKVVPCVHMHSHTYSQ